MGIYIFKWSSLKGHLIKDQGNSRSAHDFGKNIIPAMLSSNERMYAYEFDGYWKDVGTLQSLWESNMDLLGDVPMIDLYDKQWEIFTQARYHAPCYLSAGAEAKKSILADGCHVYGKVSNSVLFDSVTVCEGAEVIDSVVMPGTVIGKNTRIHKAIIGADARIGENVEIGANCGLDIFIDNGICSKGVSLIGPGVSVDGSVKIGRNSYISTNLPLINSKRRPINKEIETVRLPYALSLQGHA